MLSRYLYMNISQDSSFAALSPEEKKRDLYEQQKHTLELFLERNAISQAQFDKSLRDLTVKMGVNTKQNHYLSFRLLFSWRSLLA